MLLQLKDPVKQEELAAKAVADRMSVNTLREAVLQMSKTSTEQEENQFDDLLDEIRELRRSTENKYLSGSEQIPPDVKSKIKQEIEGFMRLLE